MDAWILYTVIGSTTAISLFLLGFAIFWFGEKTKYWDRRLGETRTWDLGEHGTAVVTYDKDPEDPSEIYVFFEFKQDDGCTQKIMIGGARDDAHDRDLYEFFLTLTEDDVRKELGVALDRKEEWSADLIQLKADVSDGCAL